MTFITVVKQGTFPQPGVDINLTGEFIGTFDGNLTGNVLDAVIVETDSINSSTGGDVLFLTNVDMASSNILNAEVIETNTLSATNGTEVDVVGNLLPATSLVYDLGSTAQKWKNLTVNDAMVCNDLVVSGTIYGNVVGDIQLTGDVIIANVFCANVRIETDLMSAKTTEAVIFDNDIHMATGNTIQTDNLDTNTLDPRTGTQIAVGGDLNLLANDILNADSVTANTLTNASGTISVTSDLCIDAANKIQVDTLESKTGGDITVNNDVTLVAGNTLTADTLSALNLNPRSGTQVTVGGDLNLLANDLLNADSVTANTLTNASGSIAVTSDLSIDATKKIQVDTLESKSGVVIALNDDVCIAAGNTLQVDNIDSKSGGAITIGDDVTLASGNTLTSDNIVVSVLSAALEAVISVGSSMNFNGTGDLFNIDIIEANVFTNDSGTLDFQSNVCVASGKELQVNTIVSKTVGNLTLDSDVVVTGNLVVEGDLEFTANLDMNCQSINQVNVLEVDYIKSKSGNVDVISDMRMVGTTLKVNTIVDTDGVTGTTVEGVRMIDGLAEADTVETDVLSSKAGGDISVIKTLNLGANNIDDVQSLSANVITNDSGIISVTSDLCIDSTKKLQVDTLESKSGVVIALNEDVCIAAGNTLQVDNIDSKSGGAISVGDDVTLAAGNTLTADTLSALTLTPRSGTQVAVTGDLNLLANDLLNADSVTANTLTNASGSIAVTSDLSIDATKKIQVDTLESKTGGAISVGDDVTLTAGNTLTADTLSALTLTPRSGTEVAVTGDLNLLANDLLNVQSLSANVITNASGTVSVTSNLCIDSSYILQVNEVQSKTVGNLSLNSDVVVTGNLTVEGALEFTSNLDMNCFSIQQVEVIEVDNINSKTGAGIAVIDSPTIAAGKTLSVDTINETTAAAGVTVDGVLLKDTSVTADTVNTDALNAKTASGAISVGDDLVMDAANVFKTDTMASTSAGDITVNNSLCVVAGQSVKVDTISEKTAAAGVLIDGVLLKDNDVEASEVRTDTLSSNVATEITVTNDLVPDVSASYDLGTASLRWNALYATSINITQNATILGNLVVSGNLTAIDTENITVADNKIVLNSGETGAGVTLGAAGWEVERGTLVNFNVCFDEARDCLVTGLDTVVSNLHCIASRVDSVDANAIAYFNADGLLQTDNSFTFDGTTLVVGELCATTAIQVPLLEAKNGVAISVGDDMTMVAGNTFTADTLAALNLNPRSGTQVTVGGDLNLLANDLLNADSVTANTLTNASGSIAVTSDLSIDATKKIQVDTLESKSGLEITINDDVTINSGNTLTVNTVSGAGADVVFNDNICIDAAKQLATNKVVPKTGTEVALGGDLNLLANDILNADSVTANTITNASGSIAVTSDLSVDAANKIQVDTLESKSGLLITINDDVTINSGNTLTVNTVSGAGSDVVFNDNICIDAAKQLYTNNITPKSGTTTTINGDVVVTGNLDVNGCITGYCRTEVQAGTYTVLASDEIIAANTLSGAIVVNLPYINTLTTTNKYLKLHIVDEGGMASVNSITINADFGNGDTVLGGNTITLLGDYNSLALYSDGVSRWFAL